jgi:hypothetical protein
MKAKRVWWGAAFIMGIVLLATIGVTMSVISWGSGDIWTQKDSWYTGFPLQPPWCDEEYDEIHRQRLLPVPDSHLNEAVALLAHAEVVEIDLPKARRMLDMPDMAPDTLLKAAIFEANTRAEKREQEAQIPFFASHAKMFLEQAQKHRLSATKAEELLGKTKPYLVRAVMLREETGGFEAYWKESSLWIHHGCQGGRAAPMKRRPLVIFLAKKPASIYNNVSMAA